MEVKRFYYPRQFKNRGENERMQYNIGILELEKDLSENYGYIGIDMSKSNIKTNDKV